MKLIVLLRVGKSQREAAEYFGVSPGRISQIKKELKDDTTRNIIQESASRIVKKELRIVDELSRINEQANKVLDEAMKGQEPETAVRAMAEIRGQIRLQLDILQNLYDLRAAEEFQQEVLGAIGECSPNTRNRILSRLNARRSFRGSIKP